MFRFHTDNYYTNNNRTFQDDTFDAALINLMGKRFKLTTEQEELIINISKKII